MATTIQLGMDVAQQVAAAKEAAASLSQLSKEAVQLGVSLADFNKKGDLVRVVLKGMADDGKKATETFKVIKGELKLVKTQIEDNAGAADRLARANERAAASAAKAAEAAKKQAQALIDQANAARELEARRTAAGVITGAARDVLPAPSTVTQAAAIEQAINRIRQSVINGKLSLEEFNRVLFALKGDPSALKGLSDGALKAFNDLNKLQTALTETGKKGKDAGEKILISWQAVIRIFESQVIRNAIQGLFTGLRESIGVATQFSIKIAEIETISQKAGVSTDVWAENLRRLSSSFGVSELDVAEGAYQAISNQVVKGRQTFEFLEEALKFGRATVSSTADSVNLLSSALKSFDIDVSKTNQVSASLFKTIELGRVRASELANVFGRVGVIARSVGVSLDETNAAIATLSVQGIKPGDTLTFLSNLFVKLLDPTDELKKAFVELGVVSGPALIQKLGGLKGFLQFLDKEGEKGTQNIEALTGNIRSLRGALGLTGPAFKDFEKALDEVSKAGAEFEKANQIVAASAGKQLVTSFQEAKNFFEKEFGTPFVEATNKVIKALGGLPAIVKTVVTAIEVGAAAFITYRIGLLSITTQSLTLTGVLGGLKTALIGVASTAATTGTALNATLRIAGIGAAGFLTFKAITASIGEVRNFAEVGKQALSELEERDRQYAKSIEDRLGKQKQEEEALSATLQTQINNRFNLLTNFSSNVIKQATKVKDDQVKLFKQIEAQSKASGAAYVDAINRSLQLIRQRLTESENLVRESIKNIQNIPDKQSKQIFDVRTNFANDFQQLNLIGSRIDELRQRAQKLFGEGTKESVDEARRLFDQIESLEIDRFNKQAERRKQAFSEGLISGPAVERTDEFGRKRLEFIINTADVEQRIRNIAAERIQLEESFQARQLTLQKQLLAEKEKEKIRQKEIQDLITQAAEFKVFDATGKVSDRFTPLGERTRADAGGVQAAKEFEEIIRQIREKATADELKNFQFFSDLEKQKVAVAKQVETAIAEERAKQLQQEILNRKTSFENLQKTTEKSITDARTQTEQLRRELEANLASLQSLANIGRTTVGGIFGAPFNVIAGRGFSAGAQESVEIERAEGAKKALLEAIAKAQELGIALRNNPLAENAEKFAQAVKEAQAIALRFVDLRTSLGAEGRRPTLPGSTVPAEEDLGQIRDRANALLKQFEIVDKGKTTLAGASAELSKISAQSLGLPEQLNSVGTSGQNAANVMITSFGQVSSILDGLNARAKQLKATLDSFQSGAALPVQGQAMGGLIRYFANGGFVPRGTDTVPAMLSPGEFVMNRQATAKFYSTLVAMNSRTSPVRHYSQGGPVTNVGDINITIPGGLSSSDSIKEIAQGLRRGLRRGTITL